MKSLDFLRSQPVDHIESVGCIFPADKATADSVKKADPKFVERLKQQISQHPAGISANSKTTTDRFFNFCQTGATSGTNCDPARKAAMALNRKENMVICIGSNKRDGSQNVSPLTEGIRGALVLGISARDCGKAVTYVADAPTAAVITKLLEAVPARTSGGEEVIKDIRVHSFASKRDSGDLHSAAKDEAREILESTQADAVVTIELPDAGSISSVDKPLYEVARAADAKNLLVVSVGNGREGKVGCGPTNSTLSMTGKVSNFTAMALGAFLLKIRGKLDRFIKPGDFKNLSNLIFDAKKEATTRPAGASITHVFEKLQKDDFLEPYADLNKSMVELSKKLAEEHGKFSLNFEKRTEIAIFDSSNGAFVAAKVLKREFEKLGYNTNFIIVVDHGNAPYGQYVGEKEAQLSQLVTNGLKICEKKGAALVVMACNTACIVPEAQKEVDIPVVDLIQVTAKAIAKDGGANPVLISTLATTCSSVYPKAVLRESGQKIDLKKSQRPGRRQAGDELANMISAPGLAELINKMGAKVVGSQDDNSGQELNAEADKLIKEIIDKVPADATSVWLTCTHYPVFQSKFEDALKKRGLDVKVINPMTYQAQAVAAEMARLELKNDPNLGKDALESKSVVVSSAPRDKKEFIEGSASALFGPTSTECESWGNFPAT